MDGFEDNERESSAPPSSLRQLILLAGAIAAVGYATYASPPPGLSPAAQQTLGIFLFGLLLWQGEVIPYTVSSLLVVGLLYGLGIVSSFEAAAVGFSSTLFVFFFTLLVLGGMVTKVDLDRWLARRLLDVSSSPKASLRRLGRYVLALAFIMPSGLARMVAFTPIVERINDTYGIDRTSEFLTPAFLVLGQLNSIASMTVMTGGGLSIIGAGVISAAGYPIDWVDWLIYMAPPTMAIYAMGFFTVDRLYDVSESDYAARNRGAQSNGGAPDEAIAEDDAGPLSRDQRIVAAVMGATLVAWVVGSVFDVPAVLPPIFAMAVLSAPGVRILGADDVKRINWGILFLIGAMLSLVEVLEETGAFEWIISLISQLVAFDALSSVSIVGVLLTFVVAFRLLFPSGSTCLIVVLPIIIQFGQTYDIHVPSLALSAVLVIGSMVLIPLHLPPALLAFNRGHVDSRDVLLVGLCTLGYALVTIALAWTVYWPIVM